MCSNRFFRRLQTFTGVLSCDARHTTRHSQRRRGAVMGCVCTECRNEGTREALTELHSCWDGRPEPELHLSSSKIRPHCMPKWKVQPQQAEYLEEVEEANIEAARHPAFWNLVRLRNDRHVMPLYVIAQEEDASVHSSLFGTRGRNVQVLSRKTRPSQVSAPEAG